MEYTHIVLCLAQHVLFCTHCRLSFNVDIAPFRSALLLTLSLSFSSSREAPSFYNPYLTAYTHQAILRRPCRVTYITTLYLEAMAPTPPDIDSVALNYIPKRAVVEALRINPTQRYASSSPFSHFSVTSFRIIEPFDMANDSVTLIVAASYVVAIGICKFPLLGRGAKLMTVVVGRLMSSSLRLMIVVSIRKVTTY